MLVCGLLRHALGQCVYEVNTIACNGFVLCNGDTVNRYNSIGEKEGKWVTIDTSFFEQITTEIACGASNYYKRTVDTIYSYSVYQVAHYRKGSKHGIATIYTESNVRLEVTYQNGEMMGDVVNYYPNGRPFIKTTIRGDEQELECYMYDEGGNFLKRVRLQKDMVLTL